MRSSGVVPAPLRRPSSPSNLMLRMRSGRKPSVFWYFLPSLSTATPGRRSRNFASMRCCQRSAGSCTWPSMETMKYLLGSSGRAVRGQPSAPGVSRRQTLFSSGKGMADATVESPRMQPSNFTAHWRRCAIGWLRLFGGDGGASQVRWRGLPPTEKARTLFRLPPQAPQSRAGTSHTLGDGSASGPAPPSFDGTSTCGRYAPCGGCSIKGGVITVTEALWWDGPCGASGKAPTNSPACAPAPTRARWLPPR